MTTNMTRDVPADEGILPGNMRDEHSVLRHLTHNGFFPMMTVHRDDLRQAGFDADNVDDDTMSELAEKMADAYGEVIHRQTKRFQCRGRAIYGTELYGWIHFHEFLTGNRKNWRKHDDRKNASGRTPVVHCLGTFE